MTAALITGAPGWLGSRLVEALARGLPDDPALAGGSDREIRVLALPAADTSALTALRADIRIIRGDVRDPSSLEPFFRDAAGATLFHAAGIIHPSHGVRQFYEVNVDGTRAIVEGAVRARVRRLIHVSSNSPLGLNPTPDDVFDEQAPYRPYMNYGRSKQMAEDIVTAASRDLETVIIRPPWFYGPGQPARQTRFFTMIQRGQIPLVGDGHNRRSMAYVDNICQGLLRAERTPHAAGRIYWIADARPYTMNEIIETVEHVLEEDFGVPVAHRRRRLPNIASSLARVADAAIQRAGAYVQEIHVLSEMNATIACTIERARAELGYEPRIALREGMRRSVEAMLATGVTFP